MTAEKKSTAASVEWAEAEADKLLQKIESNRDREWSKRDIAFALCSARFEGAFEVWAENFDKMKALIEESHTRIIYSGDKPMTARGFKQWIQGALQREKVS